MPILYRIAFVAAAGLVLVPLTAPGRVPAAAPLAGPERVRQSRGYLRQAIDEYKTGKPDRSRFHWRIARDMAPRWADRRPEFHKLDGLLHLGAGRRDAAMQAFTLALNLKPDPFLYYLQGDYYLEFRNLREARASYAGAIAAFFGRNKKATALPSPEYTLAARLPLICPGENPEKYDGWLERGLKNHFSATEWAAVNWGRTLSKEELVLSILQAMLLARYFDRDGKAVEQYRGWLAGINLDEDEVSFKATLSLVRGPLRDVNHTRCLHGLEAMKRRQEKAIATGLSDQARHHLKTIREYLRRAHWNRIAVRGDVAAYYSYGSYLMRQDRPTEALHNFRRALTLTDYRLEPDAGAKSLHEAAQTYRQIQFAYARMGLEKDAETAGKFAAALEGLSARIEAGRPGAAAEVLRVRKFLVKRARENFHSREGLVYLLRHAGSVKGETVASLRKRLEKRDARADERELMSAFGYLYR